MVGKTFSNRLNPILTDIFDPNIKYTGAYELIEIFPIIITANLSHAKFSVILCHLNSVNES